MYIHKNGITGHVITVTLSIGEFLAINNTSWRGPGTVKNRGKERYLLCATEKNWWFPKKNSKHHSPTYVMSWVVAFPCQKCGVIFLYCVVFSRVYNYGRTVTMTEMGERFQFIKTILVNKQHLLISCIQKRTDPLRVSISLIKTMGFSFGVF